MSGSEQGAGDASVNAASDVDTVSSVGATNVTQLLRARGWLQHQLTDIKSEVLAVRNRSLRHTDDEEAVQDRVKELQIKLEAVTTQVHTRDLLAQRLQLGKCLDSLLDGKNKGLDQGDRIDLTQKDRNIQELLEKSVKISSEICEVKQQNEEHRLAHSEVKKEVIAMKMSQRETMFELEQEKEAHESLSGISSSNTAILEMQETLKSSQMTVELMRHVFLKLILGSGVDWAMDPELTKLVISLGTPFKTGAGNPRV